MMEMDKNNIVPFPSDRARKNLRSRQHRKKEADGSNIRLYTLAVDLTEGPITKEFDGARISRTIQIKGDQTLQALHGAIFDAFDRVDEHLYEFNFGKDAFDRSGKRYTPHDYYEDSARDEIDGSDTAAATIDSLGLGEGRTFTYWFDFGDDWLHRIRVVAVEEAPAGGVFPRITEKVGESPPQYPDFGDEAVEGHPLPELMTPDVVMEHLRAEWRRELEEKTLRANTTLQAALNKLPALWVKAICERVGLPEFRLAKERVKALVKHLPEKKSLGDIWRQLPEPPRRMMKWILDEQNAAAPIGKLEDRFGADTDTSWFWDDGEIPTTALGLLRVYGLAFVGMTRIGTEKKRSAVVPLELRDGLRMLAATPDAFENAPPMPLSEEEPVPSEEGRDIEEYLRELIVGDVEWEIEKESLEVLELENFLKKYPFSRMTEWLYENALEEVSEHPRDFPIDAINELLHRAIEKGKVNTRLMSYRLGVAVFGNTFARRALQDKSKRIIKWADKILDSRQGDLF